MSKIRKLRSLGTNIFITWTTLISCFLRFSYGVVLLYSWLFEISWFSLLSSSEVDGSGASFQQLSKCQGHSLARLRKVKYGAVWRGVMLKEIEERLRRSADSVRKIIQIHKVFCCRQLLDCPKSAQPAKEDELWARHILCHPFKTARELKGKSLRLPTSPWGPSSTCAKRGWGCPHDAALRSPSSWPTWKKRG